MWYETLESQEAYEKLPSDDKIFLRDIKHHAEANKMQIDMILLQNHPLSKKLHNWINSSEKNKKWYAENTNKLRLVPNWIEILWEIYDLEDISPKKKSFILDDLKWSRSDAENYAKKVWKSIPDWASVVRIFPRDSWESFFKDVMWMTRLYLSVSSDSISTSKDRIVFWSALSTSWKLRLKK